MRVILQYSGITEGVQLILDCPDRNIHYYGDISLASTYDITNLELSQFNLWKEHVRSVLCPAHKRDHGRGNYPYHKVRVNGMNIEGGM